MQRASSNRPGFHHSLSVTPLSAGSNWVLPQRTHGGEKTDLLCDSLASLDHWDDGLMGIVAHEGSLDRSDVVLWTGSKAISRMRLICGVGLLGMHC